MGGRRKYDIVEVDTKAIKAELAKFGMDQKTFSERCGKSPNWLSGIFSRPEVDRSTVAFIEERLFKEPGTFTIEIEDEPQKPVQKQGGVSEGTGILLHQILTQTSALTSSVPKVDETVTKVIYRIDGLKAGEERKIDELIKAVKETQAENKLVLDAILQKDKEICTLAAKLLSMFDRSR